MQFSFLCLKARQSEVKEEYTFDPELFLSQAMTKVDWSFDVKVRSCVNERFNDALAEECELNGREYTFLVWRVCWNKHLSTCGSEHQYHSPFKMP